MQQLSGSEKETTLVTAEAMREMTLSKEALFEKQKDGVLDSLMSSMVRVASEQGGKGYTASVSAKFDPALLASITKELETLGYVVKTEAQSTPTLGSVIAITVTW